MSMRRKRLSRLQYERGTATAADKSLLSRFFMCENKRWADDLRCVPHATRSASSHAEVPQLVKKHLTPVVANGYEFPYERWSKNIEQGTKDRERCRIPLLLNAVVDTLCNGVDAVGQFENTENEGACTSLNASFLLWLLMLSSSLEGCQASCKSRIRLLKQGTQCSLAKSSKLSPLGRANHEIRAKQAKSARNAPCRREW
jgi:hypothetical protein